MKIRNLLEYISIVCLIIILCAARPNYSHAEAAVPTGMHGSIAAPSWPPRPEPLLVDPERSQFDPQAETCLGTLTFGRYMRIVYMSYRDVKWEIYIQDGCPSPKVDRLTENSAFDGYPRLNNTMSRIVFVSDRDGQDEIYTMDLVGRDIQRLTEDPGVDTYPAWSPDGQQIVFVSDRGGDPDLYLMNRDGSNVHLLAHLDGMDVEPVWSPDGRQIAWVHWTSDTNGMIFTLEPNGSAGPIPLTSDLAVPARPAWSPDGKYLAFEADPDGDGRRDLAWIDLSDISFHWRSCTSNWYGVCDFRMGSFWPDNDMALGTIVSYSANGATQYVRYANLYVMELSDTGFDYSLPLSQLDYAPDAVSTDVSAPVSQVLPLPPFSPASGFGITVKASDSGNAGIYELAAAYSTNLDPVWHTWRDIQIEGDPASIEQTFYKSDSLNLTPGTTLYFRSSAMDGAAHYEPVHTLPDTSTQIYSWGAFGTVIDQRGKPLETVSATVTPSAMNQPQTDPAGELGIYLQNNGSYRATFVRPGYTSPPSQVFNSQLGQDLHFLSVLPTGDNLLQNGQFEDPDGALNSWQPDGTIATSVGTGHTGAQSAFLGADCAVSICFTPTETLTTGSFTSNKMVASSEGEIHAIYLTYSSNSLSMNYTNRNDNGQWSSPMVIGITNSSEISDLVADPSGNIAFLYWAESQTLQLAFKPHNQPWIFQPAPINASGYKMARFDAQGRLHALLSDNMYRLFYTRRETDGNWTKPMLVYEQNQGERFDLQPGPDGIVHIVYLIPERHGFGYMRLLPNGELSVPEEVNLDEIVPVSGLTPHLFLAPDGVLHLIMDFYPLMYFSRSLANGWSGMQSPFQDFTPYHNYYFRGAVMDNNGNLHVIIANAYQNATSLEWMVQRAGQDHFEMYHLNNDPAETVFSLGVTPAGKAFLASSRGYWSAGAYFRMTDTSAAAKDGSLSQSLMIPVDIHQPTLSFLYRLDQFLPAGDTGLDVILEAQVGAPVKLLSLHDLNTWQHVLGRPFLLEGSNGKDYIPFISGRWRRNCTPFN